MKLFSKILLASHNSTGAQAAEQLAINIAVQNQAQIQHIIIVPDFWQWMTGDDWLNNARTQQEYGNYVESELEQEISTHIERLKIITQEKSVSYSYELYKGVPDRTFVEIANSDHFDLAVVGSPRPKGVDGLNSKLLTKTLPIQVKIPLLIAPFPTNNF